MNKHMQFSMLNFQCSSNGALPLERSLFIDHCSLIISSEGGF